VTAPLTLALDASTYTGSVAVIGGGAILAQAETAMRGEHEERLMPAVARALADARVSPSGVGRVVCGAGPGSFTSLRIAASIAKGIAAAAEVPLFAVPSLALIVAGNDIAPGRWLAVLDALRGESYVAGYERVNGTIREVAAFALVSNAAVEPMALALGARSIGPTQGVIAAAPHARGVLAMADWLAENAPVDVATWEPRYGRVAEAQARWEREHGRPLGG
jgi:tRNA threonylcarbamoyladenosine biosynthesis protein TsaB